MTVQKTQIQQRLPAQEHLLLDYLNRLDKHRKDRHAVHIHLSRLMAQNRREHHVRIAANTFDSLVRMLKGQIFVLGNSDLMFVFKEAALDDVEAAIIKLRFLFSDDPMLADDTEDRQGVFATWYALAKDYDKVIELSRRMVAEEEQRRAQELQKSQGANVARSRPRSTDDLTPELLARCEQALVQADLANLLRRQAICAIVGKGAPEPVFNELFISIADLRDTLLPNVNLNSSRWLFQQLTETLDRRVLALLNKHDDRTIAGNVSINLNVATLLSPDFLTFDDNIKAGARGTIVLELQKVDIFADLGAYLFARDFAHERGYRICIDGMNHMTLPFIDRGRLGADLVKVVWDDDMLQGNQASRERLAEAIERTGPSRVILCRCDTQEAITLGHSLGITLFQGRHVENLLAAEMRRRNGGFVRGRIR
ncbi:EAL domain-containing protein [Telmatospirillum sp. J64-1]|uniref:EAL domain-containing protein n=1 Tax=Telmatospirillum sp. J64-1 TaxID=2502183 RepID=UPI00115ED34B|nr:EAL domain-containing protein [Telmatospirillum sp. J64-1]